MKRQLIILINIILLISCQDDERNRINKCLKDGGSWNYQNNICDSKSSENRDRFNDGMLLFENNCQACHSKKLNKVLTGPALAHVSKFRSREWLYNFSKYSYYMIHYGDSIALCNWNRYKPIIKSSFISTFEHGMYKTTTGVSDKPLKQVDQALKLIYDWIENESHKQQISVDSMEAIYNCSEAESKSSYENWHKKYDVKFNWQNDFTNQSSKINIPRITIETNDKNDISVYKNRFSIFLANSKIVIPCIKLENSNIYIPVETNGMKQMEIPRDEIVYIIGEKYIHPEVMYLMIEWKEDNTSIKIIEKNYNLTLSELKTKIAHNIE